MSSNRGHLDDDNRWAIYPTTGLPGGQLKLAQDLAAQLQTAVLDSWQNNATDESENDHGLYRPIDEYDNGQPGNLVLPRARPGLDWWGNYQSLPYLPDPEEIPAADLQRVQLDQGFPVNVSDNRVTGTTIVSPAFSTQGPNRLLVVALTFAGGTGDTVFPITVSDSNGLTWTKRIEKLDGVVAGAAVWTAFSAAKITGGTVTVTTSIATTAGIFSIYAFANANPVFTGSASGGRSSTTSTPIDSTALNIAASSWVVGAFTDGNDDTGITGLLANSKQENTLLDIANGNSFATARLAVPQPTGQTATIGYSESDAFINTAALEIQVLWQPDEDYWVNGVPPGQSAVYQQLPYGSGWQTDEPVSAPPPSLVDDSDTWSSDVAPIQASYQRFAWALPDVEDAPAGNLQQQPDEDFLALPGTTPPWPQWLQLYQAQPYQRGQDVEDAPAGNLQEQLDEDFWSTPSTSVPWPVQLTYFQQLPWALVPRDPEEVPAGNLQFQQDEDFWRLAGLPPAPVQLAYFQVNPIGSGADFEDVPAGQLSATGQRDEDLWQPPNLSPPFAVSLTYYQRQPYALSLWDPEELPAGQFSATGQRDEDLLLPPGLLPPWPQSQAFFQSLPLRDVEDLSLTIPHLQPDEDLWFQAGVELTWQARMYAPDPDVSVIGPITFNPDDDTYPVAQPAPAGYSVLVYLPDADTSGPLFTPDEDPQLFAAPPQPYLVTAYLPDADATAPLFTPDEDFAPSVAAPAQAWPPQPYLVDTDTTAFVPEEDPWQLPTWSQSQPMPRAVLDDSERPTPVVVFFTPSDEDQPVLSAPQLWQLPPPWLFSSLWFQETQDLYIAQIAENLGGTPTRAISVLPGATGPVVTTSGLTASAQGQPASSTANQAQGSGSLAGITGGPTKAS